jgi:hypothetical protein
MVYNVRKRSRGDEVEIGLSFRRPAGNRGVVGGKFAVADFDGDGNRIGDRFLKHQRGSLDTGLERREP